MSSTYMTHSCKVIQVLGEHGPLSVSIWMGKTELNLGSVGYEPFSEAHLQSSPHVETCLWKSLVVHFFRVSFYS